MSKTLAKKLSGKETIRFRLSVKLLLSFLVISLLPLGVVLFLNVQSTKTALETEAYKSLFASASHSRLLLSGFIQSNLGIISAESHLPDIARFLSLSPEKKKDPAEQERLLQMFLSLMGKNRQFLSSYALLDINGKIVFDSDSGRIGSDLSDRSYFKQALETGMPYGSDVEFDQQTGQAFIYFSSPVQGKDGRFTGVLRTRYGAAVIQQLMGDNTGLLGPKSFAMVVNSHNLILASGLFSYGKATEIIFTPIMEIPDEQLKQMQEDRLIPSRPKRGLGPEFTDFQQGILNADDRNRYFTGTVPHAGDEGFAAAVISLDDVGWRIAFFQPKKAFLASANQQRTYTLLLGVIIIAFISAAAQWWAKYLSRPILELTGIVGQISRLGFSAVQVSSGQDESGPNVTPLLKSQENRGLNLKRFFSYRFWHSFFQTTGDGDEAADSKDSGPGQKPLLEIKKTTREDEIGVLYNGFVDMIRHITTKEKESQSLHTELKANVSHFHDLFLALQTAVDTKTFSYRIDPSSDEDDLCDSLNKVLEALEQADAASKRQNWLKNGQAELSTVIGGDQDIRSLCAKALQFIASYTGALIGTIFVFDETKDEFYLAAGYALKGGRRFSGKFKEGEGLSGQAALQRKIILVDDVPDDYIHLDSSLICGAPKAIAAIPLVFEDQVKGIIELGGLNRFSPAQIEFFESVAATLAASLNAAMFHHKLKRLLGRAGRDGAFS